MIEWTEISGIHHLQLAAERTGRLLHRLTLET